MFCSLCRAFLSADNRASLQAGEDITDGIDINSWSLGEGKNSVDFSVWDFAGQTVYYNTHQVLLTFSLVFRVAAAS